MAEVDSKRFFSGYPIELENKDAINAMCVEAEVLLKGELPDRVDPELSPLWKDGWLKVENQGQIGSCQGNALTECLEYCYPIVNPGKVLQFSRMYAYIASQMENNLRSDQGSTLEGGTRAALKGICTEAVGPYPQSYPGWQYITPAMKADAENHKLRSVVAMESADHIVSFIGSGCGIVQIGISWNDYLQSAGGDGFITDFRPGARDGGHSVVFCGYVPDDDVKRKSSRGKWLKLKNSHAIRYGIRGFSYVDLNAVDKMFKHQFTSMYGRSDLETPRVRPLPVDWTRESLLG